MHDAGLAEHLAVEAARDLVYVVGEDRRSGRRASRVDAPQPVQLGSASPTE